MASSLAIGAAAAADSDAELDVREGRAAAEATEEHALPV